MNIPSKEELDEQPSRDFARIAAGAAKSYMNSGDIRYRNKFYVWAKTQGHSAAYAEKRFYDEMTKLQAFDNNYRPEYLLDANVDSKVDDLLASGKKVHTPKLASVYPAYYFEVPTGVTHMDFYAIARMVKLSDGALQHAFKKLMLSGVRTGGKPVAKDIKEARDTLNRWLELEGESDA